MKNREIKFKVWDIEEKQFVEYYSIGINMVHVVKGDHCFLVNNEDESDERKAELESKGIEIKNEYILCQFTGLFDKNGKEIYENDCVNYYFKNNSKKITGIIKWEQQACTFWLKWFCEEGKSRYHELQATSGGDTFQNDYIEVIGNIYENPELIQTKKQ